MSQKNKIQRFYFACLCLSFNENFDNVIFIDEVTVELRLFTHRTWYKKFEIEVYRGKVGRPRHCPK